jgi:hypothetical protein
LETALGHSARGDDEWRFARRAALITLIAAALFGSYSYLYRFFSDKFYRTTGEASWIWRSGERLSKGAPAVVYAATDFEVPEGMHHVKVNVVADPEYMLYLNGQPIGGNVFAVSRAIDVFEVTTLVKKGTNRVVIACRSANGAGAILASVDFGPMRRNLIVSDESWRIFPRFDPRIMTPGWVEGSRAPLVFGPQPFGRWNYLDRVEREIDRAEQRELGAAAVEGFDTALPEIRTPSGVAVVVSRPVSARAFDFGPIEGRARFIRPTANETRVVQVRYANHESEFEVEGPTHPLVFAEGELDVLDPPRRSYRYIIVYAPDVEARAQVSGQ